MIKFSIITVTKNSDNTILYNLNSVASQKYTNYEHIIKDGISTDTTLNIVKNFQSRNLILISKKDSGIYDATNQGFDISNGDIVVYLNSDDYFVDNTVLSDIAEVFQNNFLDYAYGNIMMVDEFGNVKRKWDMISHQSTILNMKQIAHPSMFIRRRCLEKLSPCFDSSYKISADLKQQLTLIYKLKLIGTFLPRDIAIVKLGGKSTRNIKSYILGWKESIKAYNEVFSHGGFLFTVNKIIRKIPYISLRVK